MQLFRDSEQKLHAVNYSTSMLFLKVSGKVYTNKRLVNSIGVWNRCPNYYLLLGVDFILGFYQRVIPNFFKALLV